MKRIGFIFLLLGLILLIVGFYYQAILAGIPYQDPTPEMTAKYMSYCRTGDNFFKAGFLLISIEVVLLLINRIKIAILDRKQKKQE